MIRWLIISWIILSFSASATTHVTLFGTDNRPPKIYSDNGQAKGILIDIIHYVDQQLDDYDFTVQLYPFARAYKYALSGKGGIIGLSKNQHRETLFDYSEIIFNDEIVIVTRSDRTFSFNQMSDLKEKLICAGLGGSYGQAFEQAKRTGNLTIEEDNQPSYSLRKVLAGRVDGALINPGAIGLEHIVAQDDLLSMRRDAFTILPKPFANDPNFLGFSKQSQMKPLLTQFNQVLEQGYASGAIQTIINNYQ